MTKASAIVLLWLTAMCCASANGLAQSPAGKAQPATENRSVPDSTWHRLTSPPAYAYRSFREGYKRPKPPKPYKPSLLERIIYGIIGFFKSTFGQVILWGVLIGALIYGLWMAFLSSGRFSVGRKKLQAAEEDPSEEELHGTSWIQLMEQAIAAADTRLAVRYGYLHVLHRLADAARIAYRPGKTNADYAFELEDALLRAEFRALSRTYEYTWYGSYPISGSAFADYRARMAGVEKVAGI